MPAYWMRSVAIATTLVLPILSPAKANAEDLIFTLRNQTSSPLVEFYVEASTQNNWGENILSGQVQPGESGEVTIADGKTTCTYDILGVFADGSKVDERDLNLCDLGSYTYTEE
jgi:hypothetical protein